MTEDDAKTKWCPFARPGQVQPADCGEIRGNRFMDGSIDTGALCIGSACMAWRKTGAKFKDARTGRLSDRDMTGHGTWIDDGYCGLAGPVQ